MIFVLLIVIICNLVITNVLKPLLVTVVPTRISSDLVYYQGEDVDSYVVYAKNNNLDYELSPSVTGKKAFMYNLPDGSIEPVYLYDLDYLKESSQEMIINNMDTLNKENDKFINLDSIYVSFFPEYINDYQIFNERLEVSQVLAGKYPSDENEIMLPEVYAVKLANKLSVNSYADLIGELLTFNDVNYTVVGVYSGANHIIQGASQKLIEEYQKNNSEAVFIDFNSKQQKREFFANFNKQDVVNSSDYYLQNIVYTLPTLFNALILIGATLFIIFEQRKYVWILNHQSYKLSNTIIPLLVPILIICAIAIVI